MMFRIAPLAVAALVATAPAEGATLVDTGKPTLIGGGPIISRDQALAGKFVLRNAANISSLETFHGASTRFPTGSGLTFSVRADDEPDDSPGTVLFEKAVSGPSGTGFSGWFGVHGLSWKLPGGTYWIVLDVGSDQSFSGFLAARPTAPLPFSFYSSGLDDWIPADRASQLNTPAWRIGGSPAVIPEPATWALLIAGFGLVGAARRRRGVPSIR